MPDPLLQPQVTPTGELVADPAPDDVLGPVTDARDLRVLIPRTRRAIDGPWALSSGAVAASLDDSEVLGLVADSLSMVILLTGGSSSFGYQLVPTHVDPYYMAPDQWATDRPMTPEAQDVVIAQAGLDFWTARLRQAQGYTSESIADEGQQWEWTKSAQLLQALMNALMDVRDRAVERMSALNAPLDSFISTVAERDKLAAIYLEPWVAEVGVPVPYMGLSGAYSGGFDFRFGTLG